MKRNVCLSLLLLIILLCTACNGNITRDIRHAGYSVDKKFVCKRFYPENKDDTSYDKIKYFTDTHVINDDGEIFEITLEQQYSNGENCKEANANITVVAIMDNKIVKATDGKYYYLAGQNIANYTEVPSTDNSYEIYNLLLRERDIVKVITANSSTGSYYVLKSDGNVYELIVTARDYNNPATITSSKVIYDNVEFGSNIVDFNYAGNSEKTYVRTEDNKIYRMRITNKKECTKYADVNCDYVMEEDETLNKYIDKIIAFNGGYLITDYKQGFTLKN